MERERAQDTYEELISLLIGALGQRSMFYRTHPRVQCAAADFVRGLTARIEADGAQVFFLGVVDGRLVHDGRMLFGSTLLGSKLLVFAERLKCGGFLFRAPITEKDVLGLLDLYAELRQPVASLAEARARLKAATEAIQLSPPYEDADWFGQHVFQRTESWNEAGDPLTTGSMTEVYQSLFDTVDKAHAQAAGGGTLDINGARGVAEELLKSADGRMHDVLRLVRYPTYDSYTVGHSVRVALLAVQVGLTLELDPRYLLELGTAGLLHDVGKSKIPQAILFKPGRLDEEERRIVSHHPRLGAELLLEQEDVGALSIGAAFGHHLRQDRKGYPVIPPWHASGRATELIHVCDVFEALTAIRPYKTALSPRRAFEIMLADEGCFHPGALAALVRSVGLYPPGSRVVLSSGERAIVVGAGEAPDRPTVMVTHARDGAPIARAARETRDLALLDPAELWVARLIDDCPRPAGALEEVRRAC
ncbi:MAG: HD domain-containing protein [Planctomycetes bacterium]|nr:HD domain-containing protein [Planctomycetota bacterium]